MENIFRYFACTENQQWQQLAAGDFRQLSAAVENELREGGQVLGVEKKLEIGKWFTETKKENHFTQLKGGFPGQLKMFLV